jgi:hypothetical protein
VAKGRVGAEKMAPEVKMQKIQRREVARAAELKLANFHSHPIKKVRSYLP